MTENFEVIIFLCFCKFYSVSAFILIVIFKVNANFQTYKCYKIISEHGGFHKNQRYKRAWIVFRLSTVNPNKCHIMHGIIINII